MGGQDEALLEDDEDAYSDIEFQQQIYGAAFRADNLGTLSGQAPLSMQERDANRLGARIGGMKRSRDKLENGEAKDVPSVFTKDAVCLMLYHSEPPDPEANDVWPNFRDASKQPARYQLLQKNEPSSTEGKTSRSSVPSLRELFRRPKPLKRKLADFDMHISEEYRPASAQWPPGAMPTELFEEIASYLDRDDIKSMRLVCREFDRYISQVLFKTVVVPFNTEIYGMLGQEKPDLKGKGKIRVENKSLKWKNANGDDVYNGHGLDVFRGFGKHISKFGMSFEVREDSLAKPPEKCMTERHTSFWGSYDWPFEQYRRYDDVAGLETAADETPRMTIAFSELSRVRELALSVDSGLGWLNGPDRSLRGRILQKPPGVFGTLEKTPSRRAQAQKELWEFIEESHEVAGVDIKNAAMYRMEASQAFAALQDIISIAPDQPSMPYLDPHLINEAVPHNTTDIPIPPTFDDPEVLDRFVLQPSQTRSGILFTSSIKFNDAGQLMSPIIPASLTKAQKEWLMETEWAQRAFMSSYMLSIMDNPTIFVLVHTLTISQLSDRYVGLLNRKDFWDALPRLRNVTLIVIPGWRTVEKDEAGFVETPKICPSDGIDPFYGLMRNMIEPRENIKNLTLGWATGGEHAEGVHARNRLLLPPPILPADMATLQDPVDIQRLIVQLPHVEELTLKNCWLSPPALLQLVKQHDPFKLKTLTLDSVSLTSILRPQGNVPNQHHAGGFAMAAAAAAAMAAVQAPPAAQQVFQNPNNPVILNAQPFLQFHIQALQMQIQQMQGQVGAQAQHQLGQLHLQLQNQLQLANQVQTQNQAQQAQQQAQQHQQLQIQQLQAQPGLHAQQQLAQLQTQLQNQAQHAQQLAVQQQLLQQQLQTHANNMAPFHALLQQVQHQAQQNQQAINPLAANFIGNASTPHVVLRSQPREGSWLNVIDIISPGINLSHFNSQYSQADRRRTTSLERIHLHSCGYAKLPYSSFDQSAFDSLLTRTRAPTFTKRFAALAPAMLSAKWPLIGEIVQDSDTREMAALVHGWDLEEGWVDAEMAKGVEFDGLLPGGTGRFSGTLDRLGVPDVLVESP
jgi:hypothetical protein